MKLNHFLLSIHLLSKEDSTYTHTHTHTHIYIEYEFEKRSSYKLKQEISVHLLQASDLYINSQKVVKEQWFIRLTRARNKLNHS